jgi:Flp pilus assembly pilin Flp
MLTNINTRALRLLAWWWSRGDERGQTLAEYGLIMSVIALAVHVLAVIEFRKTLPIGFNSASDCLNAASTVSPTC